MHPCPGFPAPSQLPDNAREQPENYCDLQQNSACGDFLMNNSVKSVKYEDKQENFGIYLYNALLKKLGNQNNDYNWAKIKPLYIQKPSITMPKEKK